MVVKVKPLIIIQLSYFYFLYRIRQGKYLLLIIFQILLAGNVEKQDREVMDDVNVIVYKYYFVYGDGKGTAGHFKGLCWSM